LILIVLQYTEENAERGAGRDSPQIFSGYMGMIQ
jgi:hypothetical protein